MSISPAISPCTRQSVQQLIAEAENAIDRELQLEGHRGHRTATKHAASAEAKLKRVVNSILAKPAKSFDDLVILADVAHYLRADSVEEWRCLDERVLAAIAKEVLAIAKRDGTLMP